MNKLFNIIAAIDFNHGIGYKGKLPWDIKGDLNFFKEITKNSPLIMGRKTWESLPVKPLPNRENIVISRNSKVNSLQKALDYCWDKNQIPFIIGGSLLYKEAIDHPNLDGLFLTLIHGSYKSDVFFPNIPENLKLMAVEHYLNYSIFTLINKYDKLI